jgi:type VII secretion integral membrane protein EccD
VPLQPGAALARISIDVGTRRLDLAVPDDVPVAELLPEFLRLGGDDLADSGESHGGWLLRRPTGEPLDPTRSLATQDVVDGDIFRLGERRSDWPEPDYDDLVETIAGGMRRTGRSWGGAATRRAAVAVFVTVTLAGLAAVPAGGPPWPGAGAVALLTALVLLVAGVIVARALGDGAVGAALGGCALPCAAVGGALVVAVGDLPVTAFGAPQVLVGSAALLVTAVLGRVGVVAVARLFVAGTYAGFFGILGGLLGLTSLSPAAVAAIGVTAAIVLMPGYPLLAIRLGRLPTPVLPQRPEEVLADHPVPPRAQVYAAVERTDEVLTGLLLGVAVVTVLGSVLLVVTGGVADRLLAAAAAGALLLRARLFPAPRQRVPLLVAGVLGNGSAGAVLLGPPPGLSAAAAVPVAASIAAVVLVLGLLYSTRPPSPYIGRLGDLLDVLLISALIPIACASVGFYGYIQSLFASLG